ncbi:MAG: hypothetical protein JRN15_16055, partial [Nitrososphaerota archaeon]|nr:hypothetical protein [Nitrososphaerota archaeon]
LVKSDPDHTFFVGDPHATKILADARKNNLSLSEILVGEIQRGVTPDFYNAHVVTKEQLHSEQIERKCVHPSISGEQIKPYSKWHVDQYIIYLGRDDDLLSTLMRLSTSPISAAKSHAQRSNHESTRGGRCIASGTKTSLDHQSLLV